MSGKPSTSRVTFSDDLSWLGPPTTVSDERNSDFDYVESTSDSEAGSSEADEVAEKLEKIFAALYSTSPSKPQLQPVERQSLLLLEEELESGKSNMT